MEKKQVNAADEKQIAKQEKKDEIEFILTEDSIRYVLATKEGRKFYWDLMCWCGMFKISAHASGSWTYFNEGRRSVGLKLLDNVNTFDPKVYAQMVEENKGV